MLLHLAALALACLSVALAGPVTAVLARAGWPTRDPRAALVLWQAVGLGGGLGILGAGLTLTAASLAEDWVAGIMAVPTGWSQLGITGWAGLTLTVVAGAWLLLVAATSALRVVRARRTHRHMLDLAADTLDPTTTQPTPGGSYDNAVPAGRPAPVQLLDHPHAVAYCLPGLHPRIVLSRGTLQTLDTEELAAVLAHEQAHARGHHDLVIQPFVAWRRTFPFLPTAHRAVSAVDLLVEMLADATATRTCRPEHLQRALRRLATQRTTEHGEAGSTEPDGGGSSQPDGGTPPHGSDRNLATQLALREARLASPPPRLPIAVRGLVYAGAIVLIVLPAAMLAFS